MARAGARIVRGGAYKPRSSPYSFQGLGGEGLKILSKARHYTRLAIITEVMSETDVELVAEYADIVQVGARSMENFSRLERLGTCGRATTMADLDRYLSPRLDAGRMCAAGGLA